MAGDESSSWFSDVQIAPPIEVFAVSNAYKNDKNEKKVNLSVGAYRTDEGKPWVLSVVREVEIQMANDNTLNHEYLPIAGNPEFLSASAKLLLGPDNSAITKNLVGAVQALGGTGAIRIGLQFLRNNVGCQDVYVSEPTWGNHIGIAKVLGYNVHKYRYWDSKNMDLDFQGFKTDLENAPKRSVVLFHMCAHNPTGMDPSLEQWNELMNVCKTRNLFPFFDCAYQGFATGDLDKDPASLRHFVCNDMEIFAAQSYSKNFGLYNERVGCLTYVCNSPEKLQAISSQLQMIVRQTWSNSANHGSRVVATVLNNPALLAEWKDHVKAMAGRILAMRKMLFDRIRSLGTPGDWNHIVKQSGMFSYTGLNEAQCGFLVNNFHIYLMKSGRINICGLTTKNIDYVANAINSAVENFKADPKL